MPIKKFYLLIIVGCLILLTGCLNRQTTPEKMHEVMEQVVLAEEVFEQQQAPIVDAEKKEKELYDRIISLGMKEYEQIVVLAEEALSLVEQRKTLMAAESESMAKSKQQFEKLHPFINELEEPDLREDAKELFEIMEERYSLHNELQNEYTAALKLDKELYQLFKLKELSMEQLENQINQINVIYSKIYSINEKFNQKTEQYNDLKLKFYQKAGFQIGKEN